MLSIIDKSMAEFVPKSVWYEVKQEILGRKRLRRNVDIEFKVLRNARLSSGKYINAPPGHVILSMKYGYDLYGMNAGYTDESIQHELDYYMWNEELEIPRFESVSVIREQGSTVDMYVGEKLKRIYDGGAIRLAGPDRVQLPPARLNQPVRIVSERYELVSAPGSYNLIMPELTAGSDDSKDPTIKVTISEIPSDLDVSLNTYYAAHKFTQPDKSKNEWFYTDIVLPGQGFSLIVQPKSRPAIKASATKQ